MTRAISSTSKFVHHLRPFTTQNTPIPSNITVGHFSQFFNWVASKLDELALQTLSSPPFQTKMWSSVTFGKYKFRDRGKQLELERMSSIETIVALV